MVSKSDFRKWQKQHPNFMTPYIISLKGVFSDKLEAKKFMGEVKSRI